MFIVVNVRNRQEKGEKRVYCGRPSPLGNPYAMRNEKQRNRVCNLYDKHFAKLLKNDDMVMGAEIERLLELHKEHGDVTLACYCAPKRCHVDTIAEHLNQMIE